jgi:hypothetical protein
VGSSTHIWIQFTSAWRNPAKPGTPVEGPQPSVLPELGISMGSTKLNGMKMFSGGSM